MIYIRALLLVLIFIVGIVMNTKATTVGDVGLIAQVQFPAESSRVNSGSSNWVIFNLPPTVQEPLLFTDTYVIFRRKYPEVGSFGDFTADATIQNIHTQTPEGRLRVRGKGKLPRRSKHESCKVDLGNLCWSSADVRNYHGYLYRFAVPDVACQPDVLDADFRTVAPKEGLSHNFGLHEINCDSAYQTAELKQAYHDQQNVREAHRLFLGLFIMAAAYTAAWCGVYLNVVRGRRLMGASLVAIGGVSCLISFATVIGCTL